MTFLTDYEIRVASPQLHIRAHNFHLYLPLRPFEVRWLEERQDAEGRVAARLIVTDLNYLVVEGDGITLTHRLTRNQAQALRDWEAGAAERAETVEVCL